MKKFIKRYWLLIISLLYFVWPFDFISDVFGPLGLIDDGGLLFTVIIREIIVYMQNRKKTPQS